MPNESDRIAANNAEMFQLVSIETTPSPNCIKLNLNGAIRSKSVTLQKGGPVDAPVDAPAFAQQLLSIEAIQSIFWVSDFITLTRQGSADWQPILAQAAKIIGIADAADAKLLNQISQGSQPSEQSEQASPAAPQSASNLGQVEVAVQLFRGIPVQVRAIAVDGQQARVALPERFSLALQRAIQVTAADYVAERYWEPYPSPAGDPERVAQLVVDEIVSLIDPEELARIEAAAGADWSATGSTSDAARQQALLADLRHPDWKQRLKALQQMDVTPAAVPAIATALNDEKSTIRRWAAALLGASARPEAVEPLCQAVLADPSAMVRRTAGDALSDLGDPSAMAALEQALQDTSKLVRWRAARFLNEVGDETAIAPLRQAVEGETEFDVRVEMAAALERIQGGGKTQVPMWMRLTEGMVQD